MTQAHKTPGNLVRIKDKCYDKDSVYYPYYEAYKNQVFEVINDNHNGHITIRCLSGLTDKENTRLVITIHDDEIQTLTKTESFDFKL